MSEKTPIVQVKMAKHTRIFPLSVGTAPVELVKEDSTRVAFLVVNNGSAAVYVLSAQTQKYTDGIPVAAAASYKNDTSQAAFWVVAASTTQDVRVEVDGD